MNTPTLNDLTKDELIDFIRTRIFKVDPKEIGFIIWQREVREANAAMDKASQEMGRLSKQDSYKARLNWLEASKRWDKAFSQWDRANAKWDRIKSESTKKGL